MRKPTGILGLAILGLALAGCDGGEMLACTEIGSPAGIAVSVTGTDTQQAARVAVKACWDGDCQTKTADLFESTEAGPEQCKGTAPDATCSVTMIPTGDKNGFVELPTLPEVAVELEVSVLDGNGVALVQGAATLTPELTFPNGPKCPAGGVQGTVTIDSAGNISAS